MKLPPIILVCLVLISAACTTVIPVQPVKVHGTAMLPALSDGKYLKKYFDASP